MRSLIVTVGKTLHLRHLSPDCRTMLKQAGALVDVEVLPDAPHYSVARVSRFAGEIATLMAVTRRQIPRDRRQ